MKPQLIKARNVNVVYEPKPLLITITLPVLDTFDTSETKVEKLKEEIDELLDEVCQGKIDETKLMEEFHDVAQVVVGYVLARMKECIVPSDAYQWLPTYFEDAGIRHREKMDQRAKERGWKVVRE